MQVLRRRTTALYMLYWPRLHQSLLGVHAPVREQLVVRAQLLKAAAIKKGDFVRAPYGSQTVGHRKGRAFLRRRL